MVNEQLLDAISDLIHARASFYRRHSTIPYSAMNRFLANEEHFIRLLALFPQRAHAPAPAPAPAPTSSFVQQFDMSLNLAELIFGRGAFVGLGNTAQNQFWNAVTVGLTSQQFAEATRVYENPPEVAEQDQCCICQEGITTEAAIHTLCPGPALGDGVTSTNHHAFHRRCAQTWFAISTRCPVCRADLRTLSSPNTNDGAAAPGGEPAGSGVHPDV
jgi:hypothetical protein